MTNKEKGQTLEELLTAIENDNPAPKDVVDKKVVEVKPPKPKTIRRKSGAGMQIPVPIYEICVYLKSIMEEQNTYSKALDLQLYNIAIQYYAYNEMCMELVDPDTQFKPRPKDLCQVGETLRKALREIAWTKGGCGRNQAIEEPDESPLTKLISAVAGSDDDDMITKK